MPAPHETQKMEKSAAPRMPEGMAMRTRRTALETSMEASAWMAHHSDTTSTTPMAVHTLRPHTLRRSSLRGRMAAALGRRTWRECAQ